MPYFASAQTDLAKRNGNDCSTDHTSKELQYRKDNQRIVVNKARSWPITVQYLIYIVGK